jgi:hypothetical protein
MQGSYQVDENAAFNLPIQVTGAGPFKYLLIASADAGLFSLNETTGELTSKSPFDYEIPKSAQGNNQYSLSFLVTDANKRTATHDIVINVQNVDEHELVVDFPIDGANMGAAADKVHVRGHITESGKTLAQIPQALSVSVNGVTAVVDPAAPSRWIAEVPLMPGNNTMAIKMTNAGVIARETTVKLANIPIGIDKIADGLHDFYVTTDFLAEKIYKKSFSDENNFTLLASNNAESFSMCHSFTTLALSKSGAQLSALCNRIGGSSVQVVVCDLTENNCSFKGPIDRNASLMKWVDDRYLISTNGNNGFILFDIETGVSKKLMLDDTFIFGWLADFDVDDKNVYVNQGSNLNNVDYTKIYHFNLQSSIDNSSPVQSLSVQPIAQYNYEQGGFFYFNNALYTAAAGGFIVRHFDESLPTRVDVPDLKTNDTNPLVIVNEINGVVVFQHDGSLYSYDITANKTKVLAARKYYEGRLDTDLSPDSKLLALYGPDKRLFAVYDTISGSVSESIKMDSLPFATDFFGSIALDWRNNLMYRANIGSWGGVSGDAIPLLTAHDTKTKAAATLLTASELANQIEGEFDRVSPRRMVFKSDTGEIIFHLIVYKDATNFITYSTTTTTRQLICSFNLNNRQVKTIAAFPGDEFFAEIFMSRFNPAVNGVAFGHWGDYRNIGGGVEWLNFDTGVLTKFLEPQQPYHLSGRGVLNPAGDRYYGVGMPRMVNSDYADYSDGEIFYIDLAVNTQSRTVIASKTLGNGLTPPVLEPVYDANRDVLTDFNYNHLWFVDIVTGDRVIKPIIIP